MGLIIVGAGLGMYLNYFFGDIGWNNYLMFAALMFIPNWKNLLNLRLPFLNKTFLLIIVYQLLCLFYAYIGWRELQSSAEFKAVPGIITYIVFTICFLIGIISLNSKDLSIPRVIFYSRIFGLICLGFCDYCILTGIYYYEDALSHSGSRYNTILVNLSMASNLTTLIVCSLFYIDGNKTQRIFSFIGIFLALISIFLLGKRTPLLVSLATIAIYYLRFHPMSVKVNVKTIYYILFLLITVAILLTTTQMGRIVIEVFERSMQGILDMFYGTSKTGEAAVARYHFRQWAFDYIDNEFTIFNYIFGAGFMTKWLDIPVLQAYLDMGILGISFYLYFIIIKPLTVTLSPLSKNNYVFWACALNFYNIFSAINSGHPYSHVKWIPLIVLLATVRYIRYNQQYSIPSQSLKEFRDLLK